MQQPYGDDLGVITHVTADPRLVCWADGSPDALLWAAVAIDDVAPDPAHLRSAD